MPNHAPATPWTEAAAAMAALASKREKTSPDVRWRVINEPTRGAIAGLEARLTASTG